MGILCCVYNLSLSDVIVSHGNLGPKGVVLGSMLVLCCVHHLVN